MTLFRFDLQRALAKIPPDHERAIRLFADGYKVDEIADMTGTSSAKVKADIHRAREYLRRHLPEWVGYV